jgi:hypothetical protein
MSEPAGDRQRIERPRAKLPRRRDPRRRREGSKAERPAVGFPALLRLQSSAGNAAVAGLVQRTATTDAPPTVQRREYGGVVPPPPVPPTPPVPEEHPGYVAAAKRIDSAGKKARSHPAAKSEANAAQKAAKPPADDKEAQGKAAKADSMGAAKPATFDRAGFIAAVNQAVAAQAPKNLDEADKFAESGKSDGIAGTVMAKVGKGKDDSAKPLADASSAAPDTSKAVEKPVTEIPEKKAAPVPPVGAAAAMPPKAPAEQTNLDAAPAETDKQMAEADVTEDQLKKSNEPEFNAAVDAKKEGEAHSEQAPAQFRESEAAKLDAAKADAEQSGAAGTGQMQASRAMALQQVVGAQGKTKSKDESRRAEVSTTIKGIFDKTKADVDKILADLDPLVSKQFEEGEKRAKDAFTADHKARMEKYKDDRYSGFWGWKRWLSDKWSGLPAEANNIYQISKQLYESKMQTLIGEIADTVGRELTRAKERVAQGRTEIAKYVAGLPKDLQKVGKQAQSEIGSQFDDLDASVDEKSNALAEDIAGKYKEARDAVDAEIKEMQEANKGLWDRIKDAVVGVIKTILQLKDLLLGVLARAASAVTKIIKDPIGFLGNFVTAVKTGVTNFLGNIWTHLKKGLQAWLFGTLAEAGIEIPEKFDLKGIITLVLSLLGLTWNALRARIVKHVGEPVMSAIESAVDFIKAIVTEGIGGLWKWIANKLENLYDMVMGQIKDFVVTKIITAGITWLISLLNPAAAFIKACKMIYDAVMWFVDNASRLKDFVDSVLDSVESIASGGVGAVAGYIENTLSKIVPMLISGLASLLGLGGIADKIKKVLEAVQRPVGKVVDKLVGTAVKFGKGILAKLKRKKKDDKKDEKKAGGLGPAIAAGQALMTKSGATIPTIKEALGSLKTEFGLRAVGLISSGDKHHLHLQKEDADTPDVTLPRSPVDEAAQYVDQTFYVKASRRDAVVYKVDPDRQWVLMRYLERKKLSGTSEHGKPEPSFSVRQFLENMPNGGPDLAPAQGGADQTTYTLDGKTLKKPYADDVRGIFYGAGYAALESAKVAAATRPDGQTFICPGYKRSPHIAPLTDYQLDHIKPVAQHWTEDGRKVSQGDRKTWDISSSNIQLLCGECNGKKGGRDPSGKAWTFVKDVEIPNFSGPDGSP